MALEERALIWIHETANPVFDALFVFSHYLGTLGFCVVLVTVMVVLLMWQRRRIEALAWLGLGLSTWALQAVIKLAVARPRPALWAGPIFHTSHAFPSGHALAAATFFPMLAFTIARRWPSLRRPAFGVAFFIAAFVGIGRLYLGVHWPSDVVAGWSIGAVQTFFAMRLVARYEEPVVATT